MGRTGIGAVEALVLSGQLRFVYVLGLARSGSTIACRLLGRELDGAVFEPATPAAFDRRGHYARTILRAVTTARRRVGDGRPVTLAIKDLSLFLDDPAFSAIVRHADHVVFTVREPIAQQASLTRQLGQEFSIPQRVDAVVRHPFEAAAMAWYFLVYGKRFLDVAGAELSARAGLPRQAIAGWNLVSYRNMEAQIADLPAPRVTLLDADALRRDPAAGEARLRSIAAAIAPAGPRAGIEIAGHSRMLPRSKWAAEALASRGLTPSDTDTRKALRPADAFDKALLDVTGRAYQKLWANASRMDEAVR